MNICTYCELFALFYGLIGCLVGLVVNYSCGCGYCNVQRDQLAEWGVYVLVWCLQAYYEWNE